MTVIMPQTEPDHKEEASDRAWKNTLTSLMEVPMFLVMFGSYLTWNVVTDILLYRTCINTLERPQSECALLLAEGVKSNETRQLESEVQRYTSIVSMINAVVGACVPAVLSLFLGPWSDKHGRKPLIMWPLLGISTTFFLTVLYAAISGLGPWWYLIAAVPTSLSGGFAALFTGSFSYMADITTEKDRSFRMSSMEAALLGGNIVGTITSPYLLKLVGDLNLLLVAAAATTLAYIYTVIWIRESVKLATPGKISSLLDIALVKEMAKTCVKKRPKNGRKVLFLLVLCGTFSVSFTTQLDYMYARNKLQWSLETYSIYGVVNTVIMIAGLLFGIVLMQKVLKVGDVWLTLLSYLSWTADYIVKAFAVMTWHMYLSTSVSLFRGLAHPLVRSILSKTLPAEDVAKVFTLLSILNVTFPLVIPLIFNPLYAATLSDFPGCVYLVCAAIHVVNCVMLCTAKYLMRKSPSAHEKEVI